MEAPCLSIAVGYNLDQYRAASFLPPLNHITSLDLIAKSYIEGHHIDPELIEEAERQGRRQVGY